MLCAPGKVQYSTVQCSAVQNSLVHYTVLEGSLGGYLDQFSK